MQEKKIYHYLYKIMNLINNKIYIGAHSTYDLHDGYLGSGLALKLSIKKHGKENFKKEILQYFDDRDSLLLRESEIVNEDFIKRDDTYNIICGGGCTFRIFNIDDKHKEKISNGLKSYYEDHDVWNKGIVGESSPSYGKHHSDETKEKIRKTKIGKKLSNEHINALKTACKIKFDNGYKVPKIPHTEEWKKRHSEMMKSNHPKAIHISIEGISYNNITEASRLLNIGRKVIIRKLKSESYADWIILEDAK